MRPRFPPVSMAGSACPRCRSPVAAGTNFCATCGQDLRAPAAQPPAYPPVMPRCTYCGSVYLQFFPNGKASCSYCRSIYGWAYGPMGQVWLIPNTSF